MAKPKVQINYSVADIEPCSDSDGSKGHVKTELVCSVESDKFGKMNFHFPDTATPEDISKGLKVQAMFAEEDLSLFINKNEIIKLYESAAENVPGLRK